MHTPESHPDYRILKESLHTMSDFIASTHDPQSFRQVHVWYDNNCMNFTMTVITVALVKLCVCITCSCEVYLKLASFVSFVGL